ncbi:hypothetical protein [Paraburkholderia silvatlantica]|uniref:hypothetical protein n=1 Tax=Paraburkholderia silvatlantica TaxID=321895 RepID=UPI00374FF190
MMSNDTILVSGARPRRPVQPEAGRQPDFALSPVDFIFEIAISSWKSGSVAGTRD